MNIVELPNWRDRLAEIARAALALPVPTVDRGCGSWCRENDDLDTPCCDWPPGPGPH